MRELARESYPVGSEWRRVRARSGAKPNARLRITHVEKLGSGALWISYERLDAVSGPMRTGSMSAAHFVKSWDLVETSEDD